jgi:hypothetical protein
MVRFMRKWLVPLLAGLLLIGVGCVFVPLSRQLQTRAETELTLLMDRAFAQIEEADRLAEPMIAAQTEGLLSKAAAVSRFLTHDDTLLASDALSALCEQLAIDRIDVADNEGTLVASSEAARIGLTLGAQEAFAWTMAAADDEAAALVQQDSIDPSVIYACIGRTDIEGFVLLSRDDPHVESALMLSDAEPATSDIAYGGDIIFPAEAGAEGFFFESGSLCLRRAQNDITLIAARPTMEVFAVRSVAILAFCAALACVMICGVAAYLLQLEPVSAEETEEHASISAEADDATLPEGREQAELDETTLDRAQKRRLFQKRERRAEEQTETLEAEQTEERTERVPKQTARSRKMARTSAMDLAEEDSESAFEKIVD